MTPEELKELQEKAALWDSLGKPLMDMYGNPLSATRTIQNTSNASSFVELLEEESKEMVRFSNCPNCIIPSTDWGGKCFKCDKQVFIRTNAQV